MHIITRRALRGFWEKYPSAEAPLRAWLKSAEQSELRKPSDLLHDFPSADQVKRLTVFNIGGNKYRLIVRIEYGQQRIYIRSILTHAEYSKGRWKDDPWFQ